MRQKQNIDISEDFINSLAPTVLKSLLQDHSKSTSQKYVPIFWATDNYSQLGPDYTYHMPIKPELITGKRGKVIQPRIVKCKTIQTARSKKMAEVFTPCWICNKQNNLVDENWFGRRDVFNTEIDNENGLHSWEPTARHIQFSGEKDWKAYICDNRLEMTCGEAPYIVSRYDTTTGEFIPVEKRIGILDRKLRVVGENTKTREEWLEWAECAYKATYGFEWQGDNLLLTREALLISLLEYFSSKFPKDILLPETLECFAEIISWNFWQMDGLRGVVPNSCKTEEIFEPDLFAGTTVKKIVCEGCSKKNIRKHNGIYCKIKDWTKLDPRSKKLGKVIKYIDLIR